MHELRYGFLFLPGVVALGLAAVARGVRRVSRNPRLDSFLLDRCTVEIPRHSARVSVDGEIIKLQPPLHYRVLRNALTLVVPAH